MQDEREKKANLWSHVGSLREWEVLIGHCPACGHKADVDPRHKPGIHFAYLLVYIRNRLICSNCGRKGGCELLIRKLPR